LPALAAAAVRSLSPVILSTLLSSSTLFSPLLVTGVPSASLIDTPLALSGVVVDTAGLAVDKVEAEVVVVDAGMAVDGDEEAEAAAVVVGGMDGAAVTVLLVVAILYDAEPGLGEGVEAEVSFSVGLLSAVIASSSDWRTMGSMWGAYLV